MSTYCREALTGGRAGFPGALGTTRRVGQAMSDNGALTAAHLEGGAR
jgi:hypothetical protein